MKTLFKIIFFLALLSFICLSIYALLGNSNIAPTEYKIEVDLD